MLVFTLFHILVFLALILDLRLRKNESFSSALKWSAFWVALGFLFAGYVWASRGSQDAMVFVAAYVLEKSLSLDNVFVFWLIFQRWNIPPRSQPRVLMWGIVSAIVMRGIMITAGVKIIQTWHSVLILFGLFLLATGLYTIAVAHKPKKETKHKDIDTSRISRNTDKFWYEGKPTVLLGALVCIEWSDLVFAVDSVPAIFGLTQDIFIIYTSNVMAILGLRSLYAVLQYATWSMHYLSYGIGVILTVIGLKMLKVVELSPFQAIAFTLTVIVITFLASYKKQKKL